MNEYNALKEQIKEAIYLNGEYRITAQIVQNILLSIVDNFAVGYQFMGIATPSTEPDRPDQKLFYVGFAGEYSNFGETVTVPLGGIAIFLYDTDWHATVIKIAERAAVSGNHLDIDGERTVIEQDIVNVNTLTSQAEAFLTAAAARAAVAAESGLRIGGQVITYLVETDEEHHTAWVVDQFTGDSAEGWENDDNWQPFLYVELAKIVSDQTQINEAIMEALGNRYTKEQVDAMIGPLSERMSAAEEGLADRYTKEQSNAITDALDERLETVEELGQIMVEGGEIGLATAADIANPTAANKAKLPTVGALLESGLTVLDISALYPTGGESSTDHYMLAGAIAMVDSDYQKGGISIKFKDAGRDGYPYVQYTLMSAAWSNNVNLWRGADGVGYLNVNEVNQQSAAYNNAAAARAAVPAVLRRPGLQIAYLVTSGTESIWVQDLYIGAAADSTSWGNAANWKTNGPVSVSQNIITLKDWAANTNYVVGNQVQTGTPTKYYRCITAHTSGSTFDSSKWAEVNFTYGGVSLIKINVGSNEYPIYQSALKLSGIGPDATTLAPNIGDSYYDTSLHLIRKRIAFGQSGNFIIIPYIDGAIYTCDGNLFVWNGSDLVLAIKDNTIGVEKIKSSDIDNTPNGLSGKLVRSGGVMSAIMQYVNLLMDYNADNIISKETEEDGLFICDENGYYICNIEDFVTDSDILFDIRDCDGDRVVICDENGNIYVDFSKGIKSKTWNGNYLYPSTDVNKGTTDLTGCINKAFDMIHTKWPTAQVFVCSIMKMGRTMADATWSYLRHNEYDQSYNQYNKRIKECAELAGFTFIDLWGEMSIDPLNTTQAPIYFHNAQEIIDRGVDPNRINDRLHPIQAGHERIAKVIYNHLVNANGGNTWAGKKAIFFGDSITDNLNGQHTDKVYYSYLTDWLRLKDDGMNPNGYSTKNTVHYPQNAGAYGTGYMLDWDNQGNLYERIPDYNDDYDLVMIMLGVNDFQEPLGEIYNY